MNEYPELYNESYVLYDRVMNPLAAQLDQKVQRDRGTRRGRPSTSSSTFDQPSSSHLNDDDDDGNDEGTSRASTPYSPTVKLSDALTATANVPAVYLQQFSKTVHKVPDTKDTIRFKLDTREITYTVDMFRDTLKLLVETPNNPFITPKKYVIQYSQFTKLIIADLMKKYPSIPQRRDEDYHSMKDDIPLVSVYSTRNVLFQGMRIPDAFLAKEICVIGTHKTTPRAHRTPTLTIVSPQGKKTKQSAGETSSPRKPLKVTIRQKKQITPSILPPKEEIEKMVKCEEDKESYASEFADSMLNDDDFDDEKDEDELKDDDVEKSDDAAEEKDNDDHTDHTLVQTHATGSMETRNEKMQTPIPTPTRSPKSELSSDKTISEKLTAPVSPITATTSKTKTKRGFTSNKKKILPGSIAGMCRRRGQIRHHIKTKFMTREFFIGKIREVLDHCNNVVPEMTSAKTNEMIKEDMPHLVNLEINKDRKIDPINVLELISKEFATHGPKMIEELF
ncbi:hypothetical protein Tco_0765093 [Tanacetum coccineum]